MNSIIRYNGILKTFIFATSSILSLSALGIYIFASINYGFFEISNHYSLLVLCWIFFGTRNKDFFGDANKGHLQGKHGMMFSAFFLSTLFNEQEPYKFIMVLGFIIYMSFFIDSKNMRKGFYWEHTLLIDGCSQEDLKNAIKRYFFIFPPNIKSDGYILKGYGYFSLKIKITANEKTALIQISPMNNGFVFFVAGKVLPGNIGQYYGDKILNKLTASNYRK